MRLHALLMAIWLLLTVPTLMFWSSSIEWLVWMSIYAIVAGHFAAWQASRVEVLETERDEGSV
jgi:ABC-type lipoprotein release transport system permease subunit